jgi:hypothetical protein
MTISEYIALKIDIIGAKSRMGDLFVSDRDGRF